MEVIRHIQTVENGEIYLQLPQQFWGQEVEIIIQPAPQQIPQPTRKSSLRGCLKHYAKPDLIAQEQDVWSTVVSENNERR
jgi:hypothetical protein